MKATVRRVDGLTFVGKAKTNHWVVMDGPTAAGGESGASTPKELLLLALGGCTGFDVATVLKKRRIGFGELEVAMEAEETAEHPRVFSSLHVTYRFTGNHPVVSEQDRAVAALKRAVRLSHDKYCAVSAMLRRAFPIHWVVEFNGQKVLSGCMDATDGPGDERHPEAAA